MMIKDLDSRIVRVLEGLRPVTKKLLAGAMQPGGVTSGQPAPKYHYDAHADWELSRLLTALDEHKKSKNPREAAKLAETCVRILEEQSGSAEVFIQLAERAIKRHDYDKLEKLADRLLERFSASEIAEIIRQTDLAQIKAIACETLAMLPLPAVAQLLDDPLYFDIASGAIEQMAYEFDSDEAREFLEQLEIEGTPPSE